MRCFTLYGRAFLMCTRGSKTVEPSPPRFVLINCLLMCCGRIYLPLGLKKTARTLARVHLLVADLYLRLEFREQACSFPNPILILKFTSRFRKSILKFRVFILILKLKCQICQKISLHFRLVLAFLEMGRWHSLLFLKFGVGYRNFHRQSRHI